MSLRRRPEVPALCAATLLSGCSALVFETLWFRQAGLLLGNALWSSSLVLASFMAGLAIGNGLGGSLAARLRRPLAAYAGLELVVGLSGAALVAGLPHLTPLLLPALQAALGNPVLLLMVRAGAAFLLLLVPATAMGLTLPVLVEALRRDDRRFARTLGQLYGWNTAGAVAGTLLCELVLISALGLRGAGLVAAGLNLAAAGVALALERMGPAREPAVLAAPPRAAPLVSGPLLAAFLAGALLLALEVVWFRLLLLTAVGTSLSFAVMLAVVLAGISGGGLLGAWLASSTMAVARAASVVGFLAGSATVATYALFPASLSRIGAATVGSVGGVAALAVPLMLPTCILSGLLFPCLGEAVRHGRSGEAEAAGLLTLANTLGAMLGALTGGFLLVPHLGMERSLHVLALGYAGVGLVALPAALAPPRPRALVPVAAAAALVLGVALAAFPFGLMGRRLLPRTLSRWVDLRAPGLEVLSAREGLTETAVLLRRSKWGTPVSYRLLTNAISMSSLDSFGGRYMKAFVYLPVAIHPRPRRALLVSYGVGSTARALADTASLDTIDVVDVSRNIIEATRAVYPAPGSHPLDDPRVRLHVEDGRFFLLDDRRPLRHRHRGAAATQQRRHREPLLARVLLARALAPRRGRSGQLLAAGLPAAGGGQPGDRRRVLRGLRGLHPVVGLGGRVGAPRHPRRAPGGRGGIRPAVAGPSRAAVLGGLGVRTPGGSGRHLPRRDGGPRPMDRRSPAPRRRSSPTGSPPRRSGWSSSRTCASPASGRRAGASPAALSCGASGRRGCGIAPSRPSPALGPVLAAGWAPYGVRPPGLGELHDLLAGTRVRTGALWIMGSDAFEEKAARAARERGVDDPEMDEVLGIAAMADRDYAEAGRLFARAQAHARQTGRLVAWRVLARCLAGDGAAAAALAASDEARPASNEAGFARMAAACGLPPSAPASGR